jgi:hypothetical protein
MLAGKLKQIKIYMKKFTQRIMPALPTLLLLAFGSQAHATLTYNVSGDAGNDPGVFGVYGASTPWTSGDISLPSGTTIGSTDTEIDLSLSHDVTLNNSGHYSWAFNYGGNGIAPGNDLGSLHFVLTENGVAVTSLIGFDAGANSFTDSNGNGFAVYNFATGDNENQLQNVVFNGIEIFVSNSDAGGEVLTDLEISLDSVTAVPEPSTMVAGVMLLMPLGMTTLRTLRRRGRSTQG